jgi:maltose alpha-D-glucosyltransferase/alpha-amylase
VADAMIDVVRYWLGLGLDGFRLDAVPYLFEADGTNGENLPETHDYLKRVREVVDREFPGRVLLAEANQWPADVVDYFGDADECHMCFNFPLMPRMFMAARQEKAKPIKEILSQTPAIPDGAQWGIFLRNHDELTLEMVTDEERDYMYAEYAKDPRMKRNVGIARRLAPLLENDRRIAELFHGLLFSCPAARSCTTATRSPWATTSTWATATACARRCSGRPIATAASPRPTSPSSTCRRSWTRCTASRPPTWSPSSATRGRSCTGCSA